MTTGKRLKTKKIIFTFSFLKKSLPPSRPHFLKVSHFDNIFFFEFGASLTPIQIYEMSQEM